MEATRIVARASAFLYELHRHMTIPQLLPLSSGGTTWALGRGSPARRTSWPLEEYWFAEWRRDFELSLGDVTVDLGTPTLRNTRTVSASLPGRCWR